MIMNKMFTPVKIGNCEIPNRFAVTAMVCVMCTEDGYSTEQYKKYHEAKAKGGFGLIITEDYRISPNAGGYKKVAALYDEAQIPGHKEMTDAVHKYGSKIFCQIYHAGRQSSSAVNGGVPIVACSPTQGPWNRDMAKELTIDEIHEIVKQFGITARNAKKAGFDGIEIHAGNGYLIAGFLSLFQNKRTDEYGGCFHNRIRLLREVYEEMRKHVGDDFPIMVRFSADEHVLDGRSIAESKMLAKELEEWGVDAINCSNGVYGTYNPGQVAPSYRPHAWTIENARQIKEVVNIPVLGCNSIDDPLMAESIVEQGLCDIVGMARTSLADPEMPNKAKNGKFEEIRPCVRCMQGCVSGTYLQIPIRCLMNPELGLEYEYTYENKPEPKKVLVVGGGVAGAQAAIAATRMGHDVTVWEKADRIGGQLIAASYPPGKGDFITYCCYLTNELKKLNVKIEFNKEATEDAIRAFEADKVILAIGGTPNRPRIPGIGNSNIYVAEDILLGKVQVEGRLLIAGGGEVGIETAMYLADAERGAITVVEMTDKISEKADGTKVVAMKKFLKEREVEIKLNTKVLEFRDSGVFLENNGTEEFFSCDYVILAMGYHADKTLETKLQDLGEKLVVVGDAIECSNALEAGKSGFAAGYYA